MSLELRAAGALVWKGELGLATAIRDRGMGFRAQNGIEGTGRCADVQGPEAPLRTDRGRLGVARNVGLQPNTGGVKDRRVAIGQADPPMSAPVIMKTQVLVDCGDHQEVGTRTR